MKVGLSQPCTCVPLSLRSRLSARTVYLRFTYKPFTYHRSRIHFKWESERDLINDALCDLDGEFCL